MISKAMTRSGLLKPSIRNMSYVTNLHQAPMYYVNGIKHIFDYDLEEYRPQLQAFLTRRRTTKREVPAKVAILKDLGSEYRQIYHQQRLAPGEVLLDEEHLRRFHDSDTINSQYIHSIFLEEYEKNMVENIMQKNVMNGSVPPILEKPKADLIKKQCEDLRRVFYTGD